MQWQGADLAASRDFQALRVQKLNDALYFSLSGSADHCPSCDHSTMSVFRDLASPIQAQCGSESSTTMDTDHDDNIESNTTRQKICLSNGNTISLLNTRETLNPNQSIFALGNNAGALSSALEGAQPDTTFDYDTTDICPRGRLCTHQEVPVAVPRVAVRDIYLAGETPRFWWTSQLPSGCRQTKLSTNLTSRASLAVMQGGESFSYIAVR